jgi:hypothetical protein
MAGSSRLLDSRVRWKNSLGLGQLVVKRDPFPSITSEVKVIVRTLVFLNYPNSGRVACLRANGIDNGGSTSRPAPESELS